MKKKSFSIVSSTLFTYLIMLLIFICVRIFFLYAQLPFSDNVSDIITTIVVQGLLMFGLPIFLYSAFRGQSRKATFAEYKYNKISLSPVLLCVVIGALCYFLNTFVASFFNTVIKLVGFENLPTNSAITTVDYSFGTFLVQIMTVAILPAICEETAHRGLLLNGLSRLGVVKALMLSSIMFGLMHLSIQQFFYTTILGFIIGLAVVISQSIWPGVIIHFMNNFLSTYFTFAAANNWPGASIPQTLTAYLYSGGGGLSFLLSTIIFLSVLVILIVLLFFSLLKQTRFKKVGKMMSDIAQINQEMQANPSMDPNLMTLYMLNQFATQYGTNEQLIFTHLEKKDKKLSGLQRVMLVGIIVMGAFVTMSTFIWGVV